MAKKNFIYLNDTAIVDADPEVYPDLPEGAKVFSEEFLETISVSGVIKIGAADNDDTPCEFIGDESGNEYAVNQLGSEDKSVFQEAYVGTSSDGELDIVLDESLEDLEVIKNLGLSNKLISWSEESPLAVAINKVTSENKFIVPENCKVEENALKNIDTVYYAGNDTDTINNIKYTAKYLNPVVDEVNEVVFDDEDKTIFRGFLDDNEGGTVPDGTKTIESFTGRYHNFPSAFAGEYPSVKLNDDIEKINKKIELVEDSPLTIVYNTVEYTAEGTGNEDTFEDLNGILKEAGIVDDVLVILPDEE